MLHTLKKHKKSNNLFYGINSGNYGFLMNKFSKNNLIKNIIKSKTTSASVSVYLIVYLTYIVLPLV